MLSLLSLHIDVIISLVPDIFELLLIREFQVSCCKAHSLVVGVGQLVMVRW